MRTIFILKTVKMREIIWLSLIYLKMMLKVGKKKQASPSVTNVKDWQKVEKVRSTGKTAGRVIIQKKMSG